MSTTSEEIGKSEISSTYTLGDLIIKFKSEKNIDEKEYLDTKVTIEDKLLCWITWSEKDKFVEELRETINKYRI